MAFSVFEMMHAMNQGVNPKFAHTLSGTIADERRHVGFGENRIGSLIQAYPEKKPEIERMQRDMSYYMLATFADAFRQAPGEAERKRFERELGRNDAEWHGVKLGTADPKEMEEALSATVLKDFKLRLGRIGIDYQTPVRP